MKRLAAHARLLLTTLALASASCTSHGSHTQQVGTWTGANVAASTSQPALPPAIGTLLPPDPLNLVPHLSDARRVDVRPVFFVPADVVLPDQASADRLLRQHLQIAQGHYTELLGTTFAVSPQASIVVRSPNPDAYFFGNDAERAPRILREIFATQGTDRYSASVVYLTIYVSRAGTMAGGGIPFNGTLGTGGGYVELEYASLASDRPYPFQSSLVHELGHAFGLPHVDCHGYDFHTNGSIMSYNRAHWSRGLSRSATPGGLVPEEYFMLGLNRRVFPDFRYDPLRHGIPTDPARMQRCFSGAMGDSIGAYRDQPGVGFELYYDDRRVNGANASFYSRSLAEESCRSSRIAYPTVRVGCRYNGVPF